MRMSDSRYPKIALFVEACEIREREDPNNAGYSA